MRGRTMTKVCCVCHRVENGDSWSMTNALPADERVTHGYCPDCFAEAMSALDDFIRQQQRIRSAVASESCPLLVGVLCA